MDMWDQFAAEAERFVQWSEIGLHAGHESSTEALVRITRLYAAGLELPSAEAGDIDVDAFRVTELEWREVFDRCATLPLDYYNTCKPDLARKPEYLVGSLSDDIADIYRDVCTGLRMYRAGHHNSAAWEWSFGFRSHWGSHAVNAMRALHAYRFD